MRAFRAYPRDNPGTQYKFFAKDVSAARKKARNWAWDGYYEREIEFELIINEIGRKKHYIQTMKVGPVPDKQDPDWRKKPCCPGCLYGAKHKHSKSVIWIKYFSRALLVVGGAVISLVVFSMTVTLILGALIGVTGSMNKSYSKME